ncbi:MAG: hypothetical protein HYZ42_05090 [Bacteroidetes bacterium]|nr:hypothetical protein [Bacteroidota bacterium]
MSQGNNTKQNVFYIVVWAAIILSLVICIFTSAHFLWIDRFENTGVIGDTIGGITAPFTSLFGSILVYLALKSQQDANELLKKQINVEENSKIILELFQTYKQSIDKYTFELHGNLVEPNKFQMLYGSDAIRQFLFFSSKKTINSHEDENISYVDELFQFEMILDFSETILKKLKELENFSSESKKLYFTQIELINRSYIYSHFLRLEDYQCSICGRKHKKIPTRLEEKIIRVNSIIKEGLNYELNSKHP